MIDISIMTIVDLSSYDDSSMDWFGLVADIIAGSVLDTATGLASKYLAIGGASLGKMVDSSMGSPITVPGVNSIGGAINAVSTTLAGQLFTPPTLNYFRFRINPSKLSVVNSKMMNITEYGHDKWDIESWGNRLALYTYNANTGSLVPDPDLIASGITDIRLSKAWRKMEEFKKFYVLKSKKILILFEEEMVEGIFQKFDFVRDADNPWSIKYNFTIQVDLSTSRNLISGAKTYPSNTGTGDSSWLGGVGNQVNSYLTPDGISQKLGIHK
jgi:hypothetical protein